MPSFPIHHGRYRDLATALGESIARSRGEGDLAQWITNPVTILIPSRGVGEALRAAILRHSPRGVAGVELVTPDALARLVLNTRGIFPRLASEDERIVAMETALLDDVGEASLDAPAMPAILSRSFRDVRDSGVTLDELQARLAPRIRRDEVLRSAVRVWRRYESNLGKLGSIDPADLLIRAAESVRRDGWTIPIVVFGFYDTTGTQQQLIDALAEADQLESVWVPGPQIVDSSGWEFTQPFIQRMRSLGGQSVASPPPAAATAVSFGVESSRRRELAGILRRAAVILRDDPSASIGIVSRSVRPHERAIVGELASDFGLRVNGCGGAPVIAHRTIRGTRTLLRLRDRKFPRRDVIDILEAWPLKKGLVVSLGTIARLDETLRNHGIAGGSGESLHRAIDAAAVDRDASRELLNQYEEIVAVLDSIAPDTTSPKSGAAWGSLIESSSSLFRIDTEADQLADEWLAEVIARLRGLDRLGEVIDVDQVVRLLDSGPNIESPEADGAPVWLGDVMMFRGRAFDHLFVYGLEEQMFPQGRSMDPVLPDAVRETAGIRRIGDGLEEEMLLFRLILESGADSVRLSFSRTDERGKPARPSRFIRAEAIERDPSHRREISGDYAVFLRSRPEDPVDFLTRNEERVIALRSGRIDDAALDDPMRRRLQYAGAIGTRGPFDAYLEVDEGIRAELLRRLERISPTHLEDYGECPQRFLMKRMLFVRDIEDPDDELEIEPKKKGTLGHRILERFYQEVDDSQIAGKAEARSLDPALSRRLREIISEELDAFDEAHPPFLEAIRRIERGALTRILSDFVIRDLAELDRSGYRPREFERSFGGREDGESAVEIVAGGTHLGLTGQIDRIDENPRTGQRRVVDYKLGTASHLERLSTKIEKGQALQLAMYAIAATVLYECEPPNIAGMIKPLQSAANPATFSFELGDLHDKLRAILDGFVENILAGRFPAYVAHGEGNCTFCPVNHSCRVKYNASLKGQVRLSSSALELLTQKEEA